MGTQTEAFTAERVPLMYDGDPRLPSCQLPLTPLLFPEAVGKLQILKSIYLIKEGEGIVLKN